MAKDKLFIILVILLWLNECHETACMQWAPVVFVKNYLVHPIQQFLNNSRSRNFTGGPYCISCGEYTYGPPPTVRSWNQGTGYSIGRFCSIADGLTIFLGGNHRTDWISTYPFPAFNNDFPEASHIEGCGATKGNVVIENDVWIGASVTILSGVTIGNGAVVGAHSVVASNVDPYAIVAGNPTRLIRYRFDMQTREKLLKIRWWNWPIEEIRKNVNLLCSANRANALKFA